MTRGSPKICDNKSKVMSTIRKSQVGKIQSMLLSANPSIVDHVGKLKPEGLHRYVMRAASEVPVGLAVSGG